MQHENLHDAISIILSNSITDQTPSELWPQAKIIEDLVAAFPESPVPPLATIIDENPTINKEQITEKLLSFYWRTVKELKDSHPTINFSHFYRIIFINTIDDLWKEQMIGLAELRKGIHLSAYAQKNPQHEYTIRSSSLFDKMMTSITLTTATRLTKLKLHH